MIAKRWLRHTAAGLLDSFMSRNNDYIGYWAPGVLYTETRACDKQVELDLLAAGAHPGTPAATGAARFWAGFLRDALGRHGSAVQDLASATLSMRFDLPSMPRPLYLMHAGDAFSCSLRLVSRSGDVVVREAMGYCFPHDVFDGRRSSRYQA
jgi:hypothetical protein